MRKFYMISYSGNVSAGDFVAKVNEDCDGQILYQYWKKKLGGNNFTVIRCYGTEEEINKMFPTHLIKDLSGEF